MNPLEYGRCPQCGTVEFPILPRPSCGHTVAPERIPLTAPGVVYSWTRVHGTPGEPPTVIAMADFLEGRLRVTAPMPGVAAVAIGDPVVVVADPVLPYALAPA